MPVDDPTTVFNQNYTTLEDAPLIVAAASGLLRGATDPDGFPIEVINTTSPANGKLTVMRNGSLTYVPSANYNGPDSVDFWGGDGRGAPGKGTVSLWIGGFHKGTWTCMSLGLNASCRIIRAVQTVCPTGAGLPSPLWSWGGLAMPFAWLLLAMHLPDCWAGVFADALGPMPHKAPPHRAR